MASFTKEVNSKLGKCPLVFNERLANSGLLSLVKEATGPGHFREKKQKFCLHHVIFKCMWFTTHLTYGLELFNCDVAWQGQCCREITSHYRKLCIRYWYPNRTRINQNGWFFTSNRAISKQMSLPPFIFMEAIRHIRHFLIDKVFKETLWSLSNHTYGTHKCARFWW